MLTVRWMTQLRLTFKMRELSRFLKKWSYGHFGTIIRCKTDLLTAYMT